MTQFTSCEQILRLAISGKMWVFMDDDHHDHVRENLVTNKDFWIDYVYENDPDQTMGMIIERAERLNIPYGVSDDLSCFFFSLEEDEKDESPIHTVLVEIPDDDYDEDIMMMMMIIMMTM